MAACATASTRLLATSARGRVIREGRQIAILGKPNVGKSSLFNQLVGTDRAIVAPGPGTTRDMLRETIDLDGIRLGLVDTAGIRASDDEVEREGVARARGAASVADLVVLVLDRVAPARGQRPRAAARDGVLAAPRGRQQDRPAGGVGTLSGPEFGASGHRSIGPSGAGREPLGQTKARPTPPGTLSPKPQEPADAASRHGRLRTPPRTVGKLRRVVVQSRLGWLAWRPRHADPAREVTSETAVASEDGDWPRRPRTGPAAESWCSLLSLKTGEGLDELRAAMRDALDVAEPLRDAPMVTNVRHEALLRDARGPVARAIENLEQAGLDAARQGSRPARNWCSRILRTHGARSKR
ncbi:MAG: 50S ribosome-binding GTPase [Candidatus Moduliflexus flocculans]|nr:50S ribosome-binding GTPase [Candidatus Moduliflexus flocculans]